MVVDSVEVDDMAIAKTEFHINTTRHILALGIPEDIYMTPLLPDLQFRTSTLWQIKLPATITVAKQMQEMLRE
jgi:hypothetical protein